MMMTKSQPQLDSQVHGGLPKLLYDKAEAAQILNIPESSVGWLLRKGQLPRRKVAGKVRFTLEDLKKYVDGCLVEENCKVH